MRHVEHAQKVMLRPQKTMSHFRFKLETNINLKEVFLSGEASTNLVCERDSHHVLTDVTLDKTRVANLLFLHKTLANFLLGLFCFLLMSHHAGTHIVNGQHPTSNFFFNSPNNIFTNASVIVKFRRCKVKKANALLHSLA